MYKSKQRPNHSDEEASLAMRPYKNHCFPHALITLVSARWLSFPMGWKLSFPFVSMLLRHRQAVIYFKGVFFIIRTFHSFSVEITSFHSGRFLKMTFAIHKSLVTPKLISTQTRDSPCPIRSNHQGDVPRKELQPCSLLLSLLTKWCK